MKRTATTLILALFTLLSFSQISDRYDIYAESSGLFVLQPDSSYLYQETPNSYQEEKGVILMHKDSVTINNEVYRFVGYPKIYSNSENGNWQYNLSTRATRVSDNANYNYGFSDNNGEISAFIEENHKIKFYYMLRRNNK